MISNAHAKRAMCCKKGYRQPPECTEPERPLARKPRQSPHDKEVAQDIDLANQDFSRKWVIISIGIMSFREQSFVLRKKIFLYLCNTLTFKGKQKLSLTFFKRKPLVIMGTLTENIVRPMDWCDKIHIIEFMPEGCIYSPGSETD